MAQVAGKLAAEVAGAAHEVPRLVSEGKHLGRIQALSVVKVAVGVLAAVGQVVSVAKVHATHLPPVLERLQCVRVRLRQRDIHTLVISVELVERTGSSRLLCACDVDGQRGAATSHVGIAVGLTIGPSRWDGRRGGRLGGRSCRGAGQVGNRSSRWTSHARNAGMSSRRGTRQAGDPISSGTENRRRRGQRALVERRRRSSCKSRGSGWLGRNNFGAEDRGERDALEGELSEIGRRRCRLQKADLLIAAEGLKESRKTIVVASGLCPTMSAIHHLIRAYRESPASHDGCLGCTMTPETASKVNKQDRFERTRPG